MSTNKMLSFLRDISRTAQGSSARVRDAVASYKTPVYFRARGRSGAGAGVRGPALRNRPAAYVTLRLRAGMKGEGCI